MDGRTLKFLNVVDEFSRVCLAIRVGRRCQAVHVIDTMEELLKLFQHLLICVWTMDLSS
jgi:putative transposase